MVGESRCPKIALFQSDTCHIGGAESALAPAPDREERPFRADVGGPAAAGRRISAAAAAGFFYLSNTDGAGRASANGVPFPTEFLAACSAAAVAA